MQTCPHNILLDIMCYECEVGFQKVLLALEQSSKEEIRELEQRLGTKILLNKEEKDEQL